MSNKILIWIGIVVVVLVILGIAYSLVGDDEEIPVDEGNAEGLDSVPDSEFADLQTSDGVLNEIDSVSEYLG